MTDTQAHPPLEIRIDDPGRPDIVALLTQHLADMALHSPPESIHALDVDGLRRAGITFWSVREGGALLGCGALRELDAGHGEIKSMRTDPRYRRRGVAAAMLAHILAEARRRGYRRVSLETGAAEAFGAARGLYERNGFGYCGAFGEYREDPYSVFMTLELSSGRPGLCSVQIGHCRPAAT